MFHAVLPLHAGLAIALGVGPVAASEYEPPVHPLVAGASHASEDHSGHVHAGELLSAIDLGGANLAGADLSGAVLDFADLSHTDLRGADLRGAVLDYANLSHADLRGTDLRGTSLAWAIGLVESTADSTTLYTCHTTLTGTNHDPVSAGWTLVVAPVLHVHPAGTGTCGESWADALSDLDAALAIAAASNGAISEIWVAAGTHRPSIVGLADPRTATFDLMSGVVLYGGFEGTEVARDQRNPAAHVTILSGDRGTPGDEADDCYHVVTALGEQVLLEGVVIESGRANGASPLDRGGCLYASKSDVTLRDCTLRQGEANLGGGLYSSNGMLALERCTIEMCTAVDGGGLYLGSTSATITRTSMVDCDATGGGADGGGAYFSGGTISLVHSTVARNGATVRGGGLFATSGGGLVLLNCLVYGNEGDSGAGVYYRLGPSIDVINSTIAHNVADTNGGGVYSSGAGTTFRNTIVWGNLANSNPQVRAITGCTIGHSDVEGADGSGPLWSHDCDDSGGNLDADPLFMDAPQGSYALVAGSPAIDAGDNGAVPAGLDVDLAGGARFVDDIATPDSGISVDESAVVDQGAFEFPGAALPPCRSDLDGSNAVSFGDLVELLVGWGPCAEEAPCPADLNGDGAVGFVDLTTMLQAWGACEPGSV